MQIIKNHLEKLFESIPSSPVKQHLRTVLKKKRAARYLLQPFQDPSNILKIPPHMEAVLQSTQKLWMDGQ